MDEHYADHDDRPMLGTGSAEVPRRRLAWGDQGPFRPQTVGKDAAAAEAPWLLAAIVDVPDTSLDAALVGSLEVRAASTRGPLHRVDGVVRQDVVGLASVHNRFALAAVADGLGSKPDSHIGARRAVDASLRRLGAVIERRIGVSRTDLLATDLVDAFEVARLFVTHGTTSPEDRSTTLTMAVVDGLRQEEGYHYVVGQLGDSPAFVLQDGYFDEVFASVQTDLHNAPTPCIPGSRRDPQVLAGHLRPGDALVLASDGLGIPLQFHDVQNYLGKAWEVPAGPIEFLQQLQFRRRSFDDDRSGIVIWTPAARR